MENKKAFIFGSALLGGILIFSLYGISLSLASGNFEREHEHEEHEHHSNYRQTRYQSNMSQAYTQYAEECGTCHMAYPARLLPAESWSKIMQRLDHHFGENAELDEASRVNIERFLVGSVMSANNRYNKMQRNLGNSSPLRITELPYFIRKHDEIPSRYIRGNDKIASMSNCTACHKGAERGRFDEDEVVIPGVGRWDD